MTVDAVAPVTVQRVAWSGVTAALADAAWLSDVRTLGNDGNLVLVTSGGDLTVNEGVANSGDTTGGIAADGAGNVRLQAQRDPGIGDTGDLTLNAAVTSNTGSLSVLADDDLFQQDDGNADLFQNGNLSTASTGTVDVLARNLWNDLGSNGIVMAGTVLTQADANVRYAVENNGDLRLAEIRTPAAVSVEVSGSVLDNNGAGLNVTAGPLRLVAGGSLGTSLDALETEVATLAASADGNPAVLPSVAPRDGIYLQEQTGLTIDATGTISVQRVQPDASLVPVQDADLSDVRTLANDGNIVVVALAGNLTVNEGVSRVLDADGGVVASGSGNVLLEAGASGVPDSGDVTLNAEVRSGSGCLSVRAADDVFQTDNGDALPRQNGNLTTGGAIEVVAGNFWTVGGNQGLVMGAQVISSATGNIRYQVDNGGDARLAQLVTPGDVSLNVAGSVLDNNGDTVNVTAHAVRITTGGSIGTASNAVESVVDVLAASANNQNPAIPLPNQPAVTDGVYWRELGSGLEIGTVGLVPGCTVQADGSGVLLQDAAVLEGLIADALDLPGPPQWLPNISVVVDSGDLSVQRTVATERSGAADPDPFRAANLPAGRIVLNAKTGNILLNPAPAVVIATATGQISRIPTLVEVTVHPLTYMPEDAEVGSIDDDTSESLIDQFTVADAAGHNFRLDVDWIVNNLAGFHQFVYQNSAGTAADPVERPHHSHPGHTELHDPPHL